VGVLQFVPLLNLLAPIYTGLAFIHLSLAELKRARAAA
jgi:CysZ protein